MNCFMGLKPPFQFNLGCKIRLCKQDYDYVSGFRLRKWARLICSSWSTFSDWGLRLFGKTPPYEEKQLCILLIFFKNDVEPVSVKYS